MLSQQMLSSLSTALKHSRRSMAGRQRLKPAKLRKHFCYSRGDFLTSRSTIWASTVYGSVWAQGEKKVITISLHQMPSLIIQGSIAPFGRSLFQGESFWRRSDKKFTSTSVML